MKLFKQIIKENVRSKDVRRQIIIEKDGEEIKLKGSEIVQYLQNIFEGGKSLTLAEKEMIKDGLKDSQWERRKEIVKLLENIATQDS